MDPIQDELKIFEDRFRQSMKSRVPLLDKITHYIVRRKGKQMRPMFIFLTAKMLGKMNDKAYDAASLVELLHTATLVGDYMLSRVLLLSIEKNNVRLLELVARAVREMSEGELLQIEKARKLDITEDIYFEVIRQKTASLIATCCEAGAVAVDREDVAPIMREFGELIGLAFQIKDDIFDYGTADKIGKPTGLDIREQKMTLPLIHVLNTAPHSIKRELINIVKNKNEDTKSVKRAISLVIDYGGISYAQGKMNELKDRALNLLESIPASIEKTALIGLVEYTVNREK